MNVFSLDKFVAELVVGVAKLGVNVELMNQPIDKCSTSCDQELQPR